MKSLSDVTRRSFDLCTAVFLLVLCVPVLIFSAIAVLLDGSGGGVFAEGQLRVGSGGRLFHMYKFRTMVPGAHRNLRENPHYRQLYNRQKQNGKLSLSEDVRITRVGKFLRMWDLDELPQLVNVIRGEMSLVGPRPYFPEELTDIQRNVTHGSQLVAEMLSVRPGMTGVWQVSGRNEIPMQKRLTMDASYANGRTFVDDVKILLRTPWVVLSRRGAW
ncbi:MAG: sugar transferase [Candidatus Dojkabacteria bacterium]|nr:sugar transferase [Candidatus Dojkabacteria bacterium]